MQNPRNRLTESSLQNKDVTNNDLLTKYVKAVTEDRDAAGIATKGSLEIDSQKASADAINKVEQKLKQELEKLQKIETLSAARSEPES